MHLEERLDGSKIMRQLTGCQRLLTAERYNSEVVTLSTLAEVISVIRHYNHDQGATEPCVCSGNCPSRRVDRFLAVLYRAGPTLWDERLLVLSDSGWNSLESGMVSRHLDHSDLPGLNCIIRRQGDSRNGRVSVSVMERVKKVPASFDVAAAVYRTAHIAADFFGDHQGERIKVEHVSEVLDRLKIGEEKPKLPLGKPQRKP